MESVTVCASGYEFQCLECDEWTHLGDTAPQSGVILTYECCGAKFEADNS